MNNLSKSALQMIFLMLLVSCPDDSVGSTVLIQDHPYLVGEWVGEGRLMDRKRNTEYGPIQISVHVGKENVLNARIGDAEIESPKIESAKYGFLISGMLSAPIKLGKPLDKPYAFILLVLPESGREMVTRSEANFHLKSNRFFDLGMFNGGVVLERQ